jgi:protein-disulfide isomerase
MMRGLAGVVLLLALAACWQPSHAADGSSLKLPPGAKVAVVMFEDLQCPECARAYPVVRETANAHHVPVVLYDFPLPKHNWSFAAAVFARFFDGKSQSLGNEYRGYIYQMQNLIPDEAGLQSYTQQFADDHRILLPSSIDPEGKLAEKVHADYELGQKIGLEYTPTIFVIGPGALSAPFVEVVDRAQLSRLIEDMQKKAGPPAPAKGTATKRKTG